MLVNHLVLAGGGHSHALVLRRWAMHPRLRPKGLITLVTRNSTNIYSGMLPGVISGIYQLDESLIDLRYLAYKAGIAFIAAEIIGIEPYNNRLLIKGRHPIGYTKLSLDIGSETYLDQDIFPIDSQDSVIPIKPFDKLFFWLEKQDEFADSEDSPPLTVVGSGIASIEIALALRKRWPLRSLKLNAYKGSIRKKFTSFLIDQNIKVVSSKYFQGATVLCTGNQAPKWIKESQLPLNKSGRIITADTFQVINHLNIFAVGDCAFIKGKEAPASGVLAVKAARPLAKNLERSIRCFRLIRWNPKKTVLKLIGAQRKSKSSISWALYGKFLIGPNKLLWSLKKFIDKRFMKKFSYISSMNSSARVKRNACRGCAAKIDSITLKSALKDVSLDELVNQPEDAVLIRSSLNEGSWLQSIDGFPALLSDPWLNARLTALHACSDIWARGSSVLSAQALISLPPLRESLQRELLAQCLSGIKSAIEPQDAELVGGHTFESRGELSEPLSLGIEISLSVNGIIDSQNIPWGKGGLQPDDDLLINRSLGTGVIFAAAMEGIVRPGDFDDLLLQISQSQHNCLKELREKHLDPSDPVHVNACTDITGFGLLGHLGEMLSASNFNRSKSSLPLINIQLFAESIPSFSGAKELFAKGYSSTFAPKNRTFFSMLEKQDYLPQEINLLLGDITFESDAHQIIKELIVDPQTCGPLVISCPVKGANDLVEKGNWKRIGSIKAC